MLIIVLLLASAAISSGAVVRDPPGCLTRPCTYTHTCADVVCTPAEVDEFKDDVLDDAHLGDTALCEAGRTYPIMSWEILERPGTEGEFLDIMSSLTHRLPEAMAVPEQASVMCEFAAASSTSVILFPAHTSPAKWIRLTGVRFTMVGSDDNDITMVTGLVRVGGKVTQNYTVDASDEFTGPFSTWIPDGSQIACQELLGLDDGVNYFVVNSNGTTFQLSLTEGGAALDAATGTVGCRAMWLDEWQPENIVIDRSLVTMNMPQDFLNGQVLGRGMLLDARAVSLTRNWMDDVSNGSDSQVVLLASGGPYLVENNYFGAATENVMCGGTGRSIFNPSCFATYRGNIFAKPLKWRQELGWQASYWYEVGSLRKPSDLSAVLLMAVTSGFSGATEPTWPVSVGESVVDGDVEWLRLPLSATFSTKNLFECKDCGPTTIERNGFYWTWQGSQADGIVIKRSNLSSTGQETAAPRNGIVNVNGTTVTWASGDKLPYVGLAGVEWQTINIDGIDLSIDAAASGWETTGGSDESLELMADAGTLNGVAFSYGDDVDNFQAAVMSNIQVRSNRMRHAPHFMLLRDLGNVQCCSNGNQVVGNLATDLGTEWGVPGTTLVLNLQNMRMSNLLVSHNTLDRASGPSLGALQMSAIWGLTPKVTDSVLGARVLGLSTAEGQPAITRFMGSGVSAATEQWDRNVLPGGLLNYTVGTHWNLCPGTDSCVDPDFSALYADRAAGDWRVSRNSAAYRAGTDGLSVGADPESIPDITDVRVEVGDMKAILRARVTAGVGDYPCVVRVSENRDLRTIIPDQDLSLGDAWTAANADNQAGSPATGKVRTIPLGIRSDLTPETKYYYGLYCGGAQLDVPWGDLEYSFTTSAALSGTASVSATSTPTAVGTANRVLQWGASYDRSTDAIQSPSLGSPTACTVGSSCTASLTADAGDLIYYRVLDRNGADAVLEQGPVRTVILQ